VKKMAEEISITFTRDEWNAICVLVRNNMQGANLEDLKEKRLKLKGLLDSYERDRKMLDREELITKTYHSILDKIEAKL
jgi:hypothetical protein